MLTAPGAGAPGLELLVTVSVLVADDHPLYREALARTVAARPGLELVGEAGTGAEAIARAAAACFLKLAEAGEICDVIVAVAPGETVIPLHVP